MSAERNPKSPAIEADDASPTDSRGMATPALIRRVMLGTVIGAVVMAGFSLFADLGKLLDHLSTFEWSMFALALALATANYGIRFARWHHYLAELELRVPFIESLLIFLAGFVMSVTPGKLGEVLKSFLLKERHDISVTRTAPIVLAERITDLLALVLLCGAGATVFPQGAAFTAAAAALVATAVAAISWRPLGEWFLRISVKVPVLNRLTSRLREAYEAIHSLMKPRALIAATLMSTVAWAMECMALWLVVHGFGEASIEVTAAIFAYSSSTIAGALAMLPGGLGVTEAGMAGAVELLGRDVSTPVAIAATLLVRLATLWWAVVIGAVALVMVQAREPERAR